MIHVRNNNNADRHFFFNRIPRLRNALLPIDLFCLLKQTRQGYVSFYGHQTLDMTTLVHFIFYAHVVDVPTHPVPL